MASAVFGSGHSAPFLGGGANLALFSKSVGSEKEVRYGKVDQFIGPAVIISPILVNSRLPSRREVVANGNPAGDIADRSGKADGIHSFP